MSTFFRGGVPLKPSIDALMDGITPIVGQIYSHADLASLAGVKYPSPRYRAVIDGWKARLISEHGVDVASEHNVGYRVLSDAERISYGGRETKSGIRKVKRGGERAVRADDDNLTEAERRQRMQLMRLSADIVKIGKEGHHQFTVLGKVTAIKRRGE